MTLQSNAEDHTAHPVTPASETSPGTNKAPQIPGFAMVWVDDFDGPAGASPNTSNWLIYTGPNQNDEMQVYTKDSANGQLSGDGQLFIIPKHDRASNTWTSCRLEGQHSVACDTNHKMIFAAEIRAGTNPQQQGIWPAWWTLGQAIRQSRPSPVGWPQCGEWDILELVNGTATNQGTLHFAGADSSQQQAFGRVPYSRGKYHLWSLEVDLTADDFRAQTLTWRLDGTPFFSVNAQTVGGGQDQWRQVAQTAFYPLLNVAVGGDFPGPPNDQTQDGKESGLQVKYVAIYKSNT